MNNAKYTTKKYVSNSLTVSRNMIYNKNFNLIDLAEKADVNQKDVYRILTKLVLHKLVMVVGNKFRSGGKVYYSSISNKLEISEISKTKRDIKGTLKFTFGYGFQTDLDKLVHYRAV